ncbi:hypothetical protein N8I77_000232 [Diaporthe amygdali]|uniref:5'-deoxynucleotidase n=1 Tax=Phomopsis amygdali TaxID=1214568 RepID=A0AAD9SMY3_PHOAM|nr:hypothetical protein N8I77_000232 [Diaporthe amygdali]
MSPSAVNNEPLDGLSDQITPADPGTSTSPLRMPLLHALYTDHMMIPPDPSVVFTPKVTGDWTVAKVLATIPTGAPQENSPSPIPYFHMLERLKTTKREGWRRFGIARGESIADHMYRMAMISMLAPPSLLARIDRDKCTRMCLVHDMAESLVGDITPVDGVPKPEKSRREADTMDYLTRGLLSGIWGGGKAGKEAGDEIRALWQEYEDSETLDSHFVHDIDKVELLLQMVEYEKRGERKLDLGEFAYVATRLALDETKEWAREIIKEREAYWAGKGHVHGDAGVEGGVPQDHLQAVDEYYKGAGGAP